MWSAAFGNAVPYNPRHIDNIFEQFAQNKLYFDVNDFKREMEYNPEIVTWFTKPEQAFNKRLNQDIEKFMDEYKINHAEMLNKIERT